MSEKKYIDVDLLKEKLKECAIQSPDIVEDFVDLLVNSIARADVEEVRHGEWIEKEHWVTLPRDYQVSYTEDYDECYDEKTRSWKEKYWHCSCCDYEASRDMKPWFAYCPRCGVKMKK